MTLSRYLLVAAFVAAPALAQQQGAPAKTTEQQARSYVASAFITGAAPAVMSDKVMVSPALRQRLDLAPDANGAAVYKAVMGVTGGKQVRYTQAVAEKLAGSACVQQFVGLRVSTHVSRDLSYAMIPGNNPKIVPVTSKKIACSVQLYIGR